MFYLDKPSPLKLSPHVKIAKQAKGTFFTVKCLTEEKGYPTGLFKWFKDGSYLSSTEMVEQNTAFIVLHFSNLKKEDAGEYKCRIENSEGLEESSFHLFVFGK